MTVMSLDVVELNRFSHNCFPPESNTMSHGSTILFSNHHIQACTVSLDVIVTMPSTKLILYLRCAGRADISDNGRLCGARFAGVCDVRH
jgi:hypothetical protein